MDTRMKAIHALIMDPATESSRRNLSRTHATNLMALAEKNDRVTLALIQEAMANVGATALIELPDIVRVKGRLEALLAEAPPAETPSGQAEAPEEEEQILVVEAEVVSPQTEAEDTTPPWDVPAQAEAVAEPEVVSEPETVSEPEAVTAEAARPAKRKGKQVISGNPIQDALVTLVGLIEQQEQEILDLRAENAQLKSQSVKLSASFVEKLARYGINLSA